MCRKRMYQVLLWCAVIGLMSVIFALSAQHGADSNELTKAAAMPLVDMLASLYEGDDGAAAVMLYNIIGTIVRKIAHIGEYALLAGLLLLLFESYGVQDVRFPGAAGIFYAMTDELHQAFVPHRTGLVTDVFIDTLGVICGIALIRTIRKFRRNKQHVHHQ